MKSYNGFSPEERMAGLQVVKAAIARGELPPADHCVICKATKERDGGNYMYHNEDYAHPLTCVPLCIACHMRLHNRFSRPNKWKQLCLNVRVGIRSKPYYSAYAFIQATRTEPDDEFIEFEPREEYWWEMLKLERIDLRAI